MKIAVTGGSGGVGRAIVSEALKRGHQVVSIDRVVADDLQAHKDLKFLQVDMSDFDQVLEALEGCEALIHMAAIPNPMRDPDHVVHNNNVVGSYNAMRAAIEQGIRRICQASSINAIGISFSRTPRHDYFPIDEEHPNYCEDSYSLSKWICEQQAASLVRRYEDVQIASMRFHYVADDIPKAAKVHNSKFGVDAAKHMWGYTLYSSAARACLDSIAADFGGHEVFYILAPNTCIDTPSLELAAKYLPDVPITGDLSGHKSFFSSAKAERLLGWKHDLD